MDDSAIYWTKASITLSRCVKGNVARTNRPYDNLEIFMSYTTQRYFITKKPNPSSLMTSFQLQTPA